MAEKKVPQSYQPSLYLNPCQINALNDCAGAVEGIALALRDHHQLGGLGNALGIVSWLQRLRSFRTKCVTF